MAEGSDDAGATEGGEFERFLALVPDPAFVLQRTHVVLANDAGVALLGATNRSDVVGVPVENFLVPESIPRIADRVRDVASGQETDRWGTERLVRLDGTVLDVEVRSTSGRLHGKPVLLVVLRRLDDEGETAGAALARTQAVSAGVFASASLRLASSTDSTLDAVIEGVLEELAVPNGVDRAYVLGFDAVAGEMTCTHEWTAQGIEPQISYVTGLKTSEFPWSHQVLERHERVHVPDLRLLPAEAEPERASFGLYGVQSLLLVPMVTDGQLRGAVGFNSIRQPALWHESVIDQVAAVASAMATNLMQREAALAIRKARDDAERASRAKDEFLARMSHELRTPLNAVLGFTELLLLDEKSEEDRDLLHQVEVSGRSLLSMVEDVLDMTRIRTGEIDVLVGDISPDRAVAVVVESMSDLSSEHGVELIVATDEDVGLRTIRADRDHLVRVLRALVSNAIRFNRRGGSVTIAQSRRPNETGGEEHVIEIVDDGLGMSEEQLATAFEPFDRAGRESSGTPGSGTGLSISRLLVHEMGGNLELHSMPGAGTRATVAFPVAP